MVTLCPDSRRCGSDPVRMQHDPVPCPLRHVVGTDVLYHHRRPGSTAGSSPSDGDRLPPHHRTWLGGDASTRVDRSVDEALLERCTGPTVDVGCGPGRLTTALAQRGVPSLGVDVSAAAVEMTLRRGGQAIHHDVFAPMPDATTWTHALLADGNIGIGGNPGAAAPADAPVAASEGSHRRRCRESPVRGPTRGAPLGDPPFA